jgi:hypothetical protein
MPSYQNFQNNFSKNKKNPNQFKAPKSTKKDKTRTEEWQDNLIDWITFYRRNIHRFIQHYFGVNLHWYQVIWVYFMSICSKFVTIASRAAAKSWLIALLAFARAVLYPHSEVVVVATTIKQASIIFGKMSDLKNQYPNISREIKKFSDTQNNCFCELHNTSTIKVVACQESGRGERSTFTIGEEFRIMDKQKFDSIVKPFSYARQTPYLTDPKSPYKDIKILVEQPKRILISSAYHKGLWWYQETLTTIKAMMKGKSAGFIAFDYLIAIKHNIKPKELIAEDRSTMDEITFMEEYENLPWGENSDAYFKFDMFRQNQTIRKAFYPQRNDTFNKIKNPYDLKRQNGELRVVSVDIATRKGEKNDNTAISCTRLMPTKKDGYQREIVYIETHNGENTIIQARRIKQIFYDFGADYLVLDLQQNGISVYDQLGTVTEDAERGLEYDAFTVINHHSIDKKVYQELSERTLSLNAKPIIYPISASAQLNNDAAVSLRDKLQRSMMKFLISENDAEEYLAKANKNYLTSGDRPWLLVPYIQNSAMIIESIGLSMKLSGGLIKLEEESGARKDRHTSISYMNYFASFLDQNIMKETGDTGSWDYWRKYAETVY